MSGPIPVVVHSMEGEPMTVAGLLPDQMKEIHETGHMKFHVPTLKAIALLGEDTVRFDALPQMIDLYAMRLRCVPGGDSGAWYYYGDDSWMAMPSMVLPGQKRMSRLKEKAAFLRGVITERTGR